MSRAIAGRPPVRLRGVLVASSLALVVASVVALIVGSKLFGLDDLVALIGGEASSLQQTIFYELRLPRVLLALGVGATLAATGAIFQALLKNPLAEPYILGVSNGCAVGAIIGLNLPFISTTLASSFLAGQFGISLLSFIGGAIVVGLVLRIGRRTRGTESESMLLGGVMVAAIGAAIIFLMLAILPNVRGAIEWMLGDLGSATPTIGLIALGLFGLLLLASFLIGSPLNLVALGREQAASLGLNVDRTTIIAYLGSSLVVGLAVSFCGAIGFVGLVVPHIIRQLVGPDHRLLMPLVVVNGALFLLLCDTLARTALPILGLGTAELPVGAVTALVGAPLFVHLLTRGK